MNSAVLIYIFLLHEHIYCGCSLEGLLWVPTMYVFSEKLEKYQYVLVRPKRIIIVCLSLHRVLNGDGGIGKLFFIVQKLFISD